MSEEIKNIAALYCRVSKEDENEGQSSSIKTQKAMLERYAQEQNFKIYIRLFVCCISTLLNFVINKTLKIILSDGIICFIDYRKQS